MVKKEHTLAEAEEERVRRLMLEGIIPMSDDFGMEHDAHDKKRKKAKTREYKHSHRKVSILESENN